MDTIKEIRTKFLHKHIMRLFLGGVMPFKIEEIDHTTKSNVLVIAPHADDEVIGCGGLIQKLISSGSYVHIVFITVENERSIVKPTYFNGKNRRFIECEKAKKCLCYNSQSFMEIPERTIENDLRLKQRVKDTILNLLEQSKIDLVLIPNYYDLNPDHRTVSKIALQSLQNNKSVHSILLYEIWGPVHPTHLCLLNEEEFTHKIDAMQCYETQLSSVDYIEIINLISSIRFKDYISCCCHNSINKKCHSVEFYEKIDSTEISNYLKKIE